MQNQNNRYLSQIKSILSAFEVTSSSFSQNQPIDNALRGFYRTRKYLGSRDRRIISNTIFGYYRWYGWLKHFSKTDLEKALILGYLLDDNAKNAFIDFWASSQDLINLEVPDYGISDFSALLEDKLKLIKHYIPQLQLKQLVPDFSPSLIINQLAFVQKRPNLWLRNIDSDNFNLIKYLNDNHKKYRIHEHFPSAIEVFETININEFHGFRNGMIEVQDIASQLIGHMCFPQKQDTWWDVCAGSGGKALHLSALTNGSCRIYATEIRKSAYQALKKRITKRWHNIEPIHWDGERKISFKNTVNKAIIDAPCSCSGTWRRNPELRWQIDANKIKTFATIQKQILHHVAQNYPEIETIVYATCSVMPEENELLVLQFLEENSSFKNQILTHPITQITSTNGLYFSPPSSDGNFMYMAVLKRK